MGVEETMMTARARGIAAATMAATLIAFGCGGTGERTSAAAATVEPETPTVSEDEDPISTPTEPAVAEGEAAAADGLGDCSDLGEPERLVLKRGESRTTASGLTVRFTGASHDSFEDGSFDTNLQLEMRAGDDGQPSPWIPSAHAAPVYRAFGDFCVRVAEGAEDAVTLDIAPNRARRLPTCAIPCCPEHLQVPAPDGTIECCFCEQ